MPERLPDHPRLHALLGAAVLDLPAALADTLENALRESSDLVTPSAFFAHLKGYGRNLRADGEVWSEMRLSPYAPSTWPWRPAARRASRR